MEITSKSMAVLQESKESEAVNMATLQGDGTSEGTRSVDGRRMQYRSLLVLGVEEIILHKLAGLRN